MSDDGKQEPVHEGDDEQDLEQLDALLAELPLESPPEALVDRTLRAVEDAREEAMLSEQASGGALPARRRSLYPWPLVAAVLLAAFLVASFAAVRFGGKIKALFDTADAEMDSVDTDL